MIRGIYSALSGLRAIGEKLGVTANNLANINTNGFKRSRVILQDSSPYGVNVTISKVETPGYALPSEDGTSGTRESSNVNLDEEMVNLITAPRAYEANLKSLKAENETLGTLLDLVNR